MIHQTSTVDTTAIPVVSVSPVTLPTPGRIVDIQMRIAAPAERSELPVILLSHGHGSSNHLSSLNGNLPMVDYWAAQGFIVIQPTHLDSKTLNLGPDVPGFPIFGRERVEDMKTILDNLDYLESNVPQIKGRIDHSRIAVAGLSLGGNTASVLLGAKYTDPDSGEVLNLGDDRIKAGVLLSAPGSGKDLIEATKQPLTFFRGVSFAEMTKPTLVIFGDADDPSYMANRKPDWHADPYYLSNGSKSLVTLFGAGHLLGGISGYDAAETTDESPERVACVQKLTSAYLRSALYPGDESWQQASRTFTETAGEIGKLESK